MFEETWSKKQQDRRISLLTTIVHFEHYYKIKHVICEIEISSKLIFASCVGYFDRAYYGFYATSSRMLVLIEGNKT